MKAYIAPEVLAAFLNEDMKELEYWCGEAAFAATSASIEGRRQAKRKMNATILDIPEEMVQVATAKVVDKVGPIIVVTFMAQQIDCLYDYDGKLVEGRDDKVVAMFYAFAMTREFVDDELRWVCKEFNIVGNQPYF